MLVMEKVVEIMKSLNISELKGERDLLYDEIYYFI